MSESDERRFERVCVALDAVASGATVLETAAGLAADLQAELAAFFVEDENVVRAAAFPFARDLGSASATSRQMRVEEVQQALRAQARALKSSVAAAAERLRLQ